MRKIYLIKKTSLFFVGALTIVNFVGCSSKQIGTTMLHPKYKEYIKNIDARRTYFSPNGNTDKDVKRTIAAAAMEGKKMGYKYFAIGGTDLYTSLGISALNNFLGSPITSVDEVLEYCTQEVFGEKRPGCWDGGRHPHAGIIVTFMNDKPLDMLVWDIEKTLIDTSIQDGSLDYELAPERYACNGFIMQNKTDSCEIDLSELVNK